MRISTIFSAYRILCMCEILSVIPKMTNVVNTNIQFCVQFSNRICWLQTDCTDLNLVQKKHRNNSQSGVSKSDILLPLLYPIVVSKYKHMQNELESIPVRIYTLHMLKHARRDENIFSPFDTFTHLLELEMFKSNHSSWNTTVLRNTIRYMPHKWQANDLQWINCIGKQLQITNTLVLKIVSICNWRMLNKIFQ